MFAASLPIVDQTW